MSILRTGLRAALPVVLAAAAVVLIRRAPEGVETGFHALADGPSGGALQEVAAGLATKARVLAEGTDRVAVLAAARETCAFFGCPAPTSSADLLASLRGHTAGLLAPETRAQLLAGRTAEVRVAAMARLFGPVPPLFSVAEDPFLLATEYVTSLASHLAPGWGLEEGFPLKEAGGMTQVLVALDLAGTPPARVKAFLARANRPRADGVRLFCSGAPFHAAAASEGARAEIAWLSAVSVVLVLVFGGLLFRGVGFAVPLLMALGAGGLAAAGALFAVWPRPHVLTFVFGTSLIGLSVDYVYHARAAGGAGRVMRPLAWSCLTTLACFAPLFFAEATVLRQMALFTTVGLAVTFAWVVSMMPVCAAGCGATAGATESRGLSRVWPAALMLAALPGLARLDVACDPALFYRPSALLAEHERHVAETGGAGESRFTYVRGATLQEALEREEAAGVGGLSAIVPSLRRQRENVALAARLRAAEGAVYRRETGLEDLPAPQGAHLLDPETLPPASPLRRAVAAMWTGRGLVSPAREEARPADGSGEVLTLVPRVAAVEIFRRFTGATLRLAAWSGLILAVVLAGLFRRRFFTFAVPVAEALIVTAGTLGWLGIPITFFTLLCLFVVAGLGLDYAIFHRGRPAPETRRSVRYAFLTSLAGLGLLAFTSFPVTRAMGIAFAVGLSGAWFFSLPRRRRADTRGAWFAQKEQSAGKWRLAFLWRLYVLFGKGCLKAAIAVVMAFVYPFARPARVALTEFYARLGVRGGFVRRHVRLFRHLLGFAWSLADKMDACTLRKDPPAMSVRPDAGAAEFRSCIAAGRGVFLLATHVGTVEVLPALGARLRAAGERVPCVHAFQQLGHDAVFTALFRRHFDPSSFALHAVEDIGVETAVEMQAALAAGDCVLMAGDRVSAGSGRTLAHDFLGSPSRWPKGVFAFAKLLEAPVFFVTCVKTARARYEVHFRRAPEPIAVPSLLAAYVAFLEDETRAHPGQWYHFHAFWESKARA